MSDHGEKSEVVAVIHKDRKSYRPGEVLGAQLTKAEHERFRELGALKAVKAEPKKPAAAPSKAKSGAKAKAQQPTPEPETSSTTEDVLVTEADT